ncbi:folate-binding protein YgfZ [Uliginosibacterium sp. sgz301328]|uniref:CAF17-like 4Fe-4S cluster assembly/insertion protein YgfZ n=1 Tax=Uliginosibacterium sp. sgz301328 TaxID=3243764 RepID=UPI00359CED2D
MQSPWLVFLDEIGARFEEGQAGIMHFGAIEDEVQAAATTTVIAPLTHRGLMRAEGEDAAAFLHNLTSNDVKNLALHRAHYDSFNSPKGRMLATFLVWRDQAGIFLQTSTDLLAAMHKKLSMYVLRSKVRLTNPTHDYAVIGLAGAGTAHALDAAGLALPPESMSVTQGQVQVIRLDGARAQIVVPVAQAADIWKKLASQGARPVGSVAWNWLDIRAGVPWITSATQEEFVAQMVNFELIGGVSFQKGCYPGQEIVARTQYLGKLKKRMFFAHLAEGSAAAGDDLYSAGFGEQSCGKVLSVAPSPQGGYDLLAVVQISSRESDDVSVGTPGGPRLTFGTLPYTVS